MKQLITAVVAFALALTVVAPVAASAQTSATYTFSTNLTIGSRGADVVALQSLLESKGFLKIPAGVAKGYFGAMTRSAVAAYQASKNITPAAGYFGPMTRAAASAEGSVAVTPVTPTNPTTPMTNTGVEGIVDVRLSPAPANNANIQTSIDVPVYGVEFKARLADVAVQTLDLQVDVRNAGNSENPNTLINTIKVMDGSTVVATIPVTSSTFTKDSNQIYYVRIPSLNFVVAKDTTKTLTVAFSTNSIDADRVVIIDGYNANSVRTVSGNGVNSFYSIDALTRQHTFKKPGTSTLTVSSVGNPIRSTNSKINATSGVQGATLLNFNVKSETGDSKVLTVFASTTGTAPATLYLYDGSTLVDSQTGAANVVFRNLNVNVAKDQIKTLTIKADYPSSVDSGSSTAVTVQHVTFETPNGSTNTQAGPVTGVAHYVFSKAAMITVAAAPTITVSNQSVSGVGTTTATAVFPLKIQADGGNVTKPVASDFAFVFANGNGTNYVATSTVPGVSVSVAVTPDNDISDTSSANVTVTVSANGTALLTSGLYNAALTSAKWNAGNGVVTQTWGFDDLKTSAAVQFNR